MSVVQGPFFNFRTKCEFSWLHRIVWRLFGRKIIGDDGDYRVTVYKFRNVNYIAKFELSNKENEY